MQGYPPSELSHPSNRNFDNFIDNYGRRQQSQVVDVDQPYVEEHDDILPDTNIDRERTISGKWALGIFVIAIGFTILAFVTPNWLEGDPRLYGTKVERVGLWVHCLRSLPDYNDHFHQRYFAGCRWIFNPFTKGYTEIRNYLAPRESILFGYI